MTWTSLRRTSAPPVHPVTRDEAKAHLRVTSTDDDALIDSYIESATAWAEKFCGRAFVEQSWTATLDAFPGCDSIELPKPPLISVTSVSYRDSADVSQSFSSANYIVTQDEYGAALTLTQNATWPSTYTRPDAVTIVFLTGYQKTGAGTSGDPYNYRGPVPGPIKEAIKRLVQASYDNLKPEDASAVQRAAESLLWPYKMVAA